MGEYGFVMQGPSAHRIGVKVYYEDTDAGGVVYYANYLRYLERGRTELLSARGFDVHEHHRRGFFFMVAHVEIDYVRPARLGDLIDVLTEIEYVRSASVLFNQRIERGGELVAHARVLLAYTGPSGRPRRLPPEIRALAPDAATEAEQ